MQLRSVYTDAALPQEKTDGAGAIRYNTIIRYYTGKVKPR